MKKIRLFATGAVLLIIFLPSFASARDVGLTLEYYQTSDKAIIDRVYVTELKNEEYKEKLYSDLMTADAGSRRTLNALIDIFEWYNIDRFRNALSGGRVFSEEFVLPEDSLSSQNVMVSEKELDVRFNIRTRRNRHVPVGMKIVYDFRELFEDSPKPYPMDRYILLNAMNSKIEDSEILEVLMMKLTHQETEEPVQEEILLEDR